jgi:hypothetical protein
VGLLPGKEEALVEARATVMATVLEDDNAGAGVVMMARVVGRHQRVRMGFPRGR